jgi:predicted nucleic acid-binding Zn ribbon protein
MTFYCKECGKDFDVDDKICEGYYNWKCPECMTISVKKDFSLGFGIIWNCDTGTVKKKSYIEPAASCSDNKAPSCASCPNAK